MSESSTVGVGGSTHAKGKRGSKRRSPPPSSYQPPAAVAPAAPASSSSSMHRPAKRARSNRQRSPGSTPYEAVSADIAATIAKHPPVFHNTFFHVQATTTVGQPTEHQVPAHLFPLFAVLAGTAFPPETTGEALVELYQLIVGLINSLAPHPRLARAVLPSLLGLLAEREHDNAASECGGSTTLAALAGAVSWDHVMQHVSWDEVPGCLLASATQEQDRNGCLRLKWCLDDDNVAAPALKRVLQAVLAPGTHASVTEVAGPLGTQFGRLVSSGDYSQRELVRLVACLDGDSSTVEEEGGCTCSSQTNKVGSTALHVACEKRYGDVALCMLRHADARWACGMVSSGGTPLVLACKAGLKDVATAMLDLGAVACNIQAVDDI